MESIQEQYRTLTRGSGWADRSARGRLRFAGPDRVAFLQALVTNDVVSIRAGEGRYAAYLTPQGRMIAELALYNRPDHILAGTAPGLARSLAARLDQLIFSEDVAVADVSSDVVEISVLGEQAAATVGRVMSVDAARVSTLQELSQIDTGGDGGFVTKVGDAPMPSFRIMAPASERGAIQARLTEAGAAPVSSDLLEALRIEAGRPEFGVDMTGETIPLEAGLLERAISTTKGCYVGQEIVIRILHRGGGRVARRLAILHVEGEGGVPARGTALLCEGQAAGEVTSAAWSPHDRGVIALGYVRREFAEVGSTLTIGVPDGPGARVTGLAR